jgi:hypothetical protein
MLFWWCDTVWSVQVATGIKSLHALYGDEFMAALKRCMEQDTAHMQQQSALEKWVALLHSVQTEDTKQVCSALPHSCACLSLCLQSSVNMHGSQEACIDCMQLTEAK